MYALSKESSYLRRSLIINDRNSLVNSGVSPVSHEERIKNELRDVGLSKVELWSPESRYLPHIIHADEHLGGAVYGLKDGSLVLLVVTDRRIIVLNKKPLFIDEDELGYDIVSGISFTQAGPGTTVILHTRARDYIVRTLNHHTVEKFVDYIELECLEQTSRKSSIRYMSSPVPRFFGR